MMAASAQINRRWFRLFLCCGVLATLFSIQAAVQSPYSPILGWDAATETGNDDDWEPRIDPFSGGQVWSWNTANPALHQPVNSPALPGLTASFRFGTGEGGNLSPASPESIPLNPTDYSFSVELWIKPASLDGGRQVLWSFGGQTDGASLTLDNDILRFQVRGSDVRAGIDTSSPPDGTDDDGLEDLVGSIKTRLTETNEFTHVVAAIEVGGTNQEIRLYVNGALAPPLDDPQTGLFKDESLVQAGGSFAQVPGTQGRNPVPMRAMADPPEVAEVFLDDWSGTGAGRLALQNADVGGTAAPSGGPLYLNDLQNHSFQGEIAVINLYPRALNERQAAALRAQVAANQPIPVSPHSTSSLVLNYEAHIGALSGGADWENTTLRKPAFVSNDTVKPPSDILDWKFGVADNSNLATNNVSRHPGITAAYVFSGASGADDGKLTGRRSNGSLADSLSEIVGNSIDLGDTSFELWIKPSDLSGKEVLFESGGATDGMSLRLNEDTLELAARHGNNSNPANQDGLVSCSLAGLDLTDFTQVVGVIDLGGDRLKLYVNGILQAEAVFLGDDWEGGDPAGLGGIGGALGGDQGSGFGGFDGRIAILRIYNRVLGEAEIFDNLLAIAPDLQVNLGPTDLRLSNASVGENQAAGTVVGSFVASDPNSQDTHTFALVTGDGDADNALFTVDGALLRTAAIFDFETRGEYGIRARATDSGGLTFEKSLAIGVDNLNEADVAAQVPPNIIVYMCDDMGIGEASPYLGKMLGPTAAPISKALYTPNLERLAAMGTLFTDVHTGSSMCSPTRYALLTGRYAWRTYNKHTVIGGWQSRPMIAPGRPTLATMLRQRGYRTAAFGKWHLGWTLKAADGQPVAYDSANSNTWATVLLGHDGSGYVDNILDGPCQHGFDYYFGVSGNFANDSAGLLKAYIENNAIQGIPTWGGAPPQAGRDCVGPGVADWDQQRMGEFYMNKSLAYLDEHAQQSRPAPFFFYYVPNANHGPTDPATNIVVQGQTIPILDQSRFTDGTDGNKRNDMIYENDVAIGLLLDKLAALNDPRTGRPMIRSTLLIFTSDNGPDAFGVGQAGLRDKKTALYEGGHRVPFIVSWPDGGIPAGGINTANFGQFDLYASFAALLGHRMGLDEAEDSANALPALLNQVSGSQYRRPFPLISHDNSLTANDLPNDSALAIRDHPKVLLIDGQLVNRNRNSGATQGTANPIKLFDLDLDLHQDLDLLIDPAYQGLVSNLAQRLILDHNRGFSRELGLTNFDQLLLTDGGADLRNDRAGAVGFEFTVGDQPVVIESLGMWDDGAGDWINHEDTTQGDGQTEGVSDGLTVPHTVRLFDGLTRQAIASVTISNANSYLVGEFRYVKLPEPVMLDSRRTYALTMSTEAGDGDLFHHFATFTGVGPLPNGLTGNFVARMASTEGLYPDLYPDGADGEGNRHPDMFRHRMFVGPNARIAPFQFAHTSLTETHLVLRFAGGSGIRYRLETAESLAVPGWTTFQSFVAGANGLITVNIDLRTIANASAFFRLVRED